MYIVPIKLTQVVLFDPAEEGSRRGLQCLRRMHNRTRQSSRGCHKRLQEIIGDTQLQDLQAARTSSTFQSQRSVHAPRSVICVVCMHEPSLRADQPHDNGQCHRTSDKLSTNFRRTQQETDGSHVARDCGSAANTGARPPWTPESLPPWWATRISILEVHMLASLIQAVTCPRGVNASEPQSPDCGSGGDLDAIGPLLAS